MELVHFKSSIKNFGDDLNRILWKKLEPKLFADETNEAFLAIGTIIGIPIERHSKINVFSSGAGNNTLEHWFGHTVEYHAVRGPISAKFLGIDPTLACTDGAILTPEILPLQPSRGPSSPTIIIPHWESLHHPGWPEVEKLTGFKLVDPRQDPEIVIRDIAGAKLVLTESLHGAILADTYGIPWISFVTNGNFDFAKWVDWTMSVDLPYEVFMVPAPDASVVQRYGRITAPPGSSRTITPDDGLNHMHRRVDNLKVFQPDFQPSLLSQMKTIIKQTGIYKAALNMNPGRTAEALLKISKRDGYISEANVRQRRHDDLRSRLSRLAAKHSV